jgi:hypothetical protein
MVRELTTKADFRVWVEQQDQKIAARGRSCTERIPLEAPPQAAIV